MVRLRRATASAYIPYQLAKRIADELITYARSGQAGLCRYFQCADRYRDGKITNEQISQGLVIENMDSEGTGSKGGLVTRRPATVGSDKPINNVRNAMDIIAGNAAGQKAKFTVLHDKAAGADHWKKMFASVNQITLNQRHLQVPLFY